MPSSNGVYSLPSGYLAVTGATILASQHNPPLEDIAAALTLRLSRDGSAPMTGPVQFAVGTVTAPGAVFSTDPSSGFYKTTAGIGVSILGTKVGEITSGGFIGARVLGEIVPCIMSAVPSALWVFPVGQTLSRTTYPTLWTQVQIEITAGNTFFNNGDGSTTFGIGDLRGRAWAAVDNMGGTDAARLSGSGSSLASVRFSIGGAGGVSAHTLAASEIPAVSFSGTTQGENTPHNHGYSVFQVQSGAASSGPFGTGINANSTTGNNSNDHVHNFSGNINGGSQPHDNMQPTMLGNWIMFVGN